MLRRAAVAGSWYPGRADALAREVDGYLEAAAPPPQPGRLLGLVSPHAGLRYSGSVAAFGYALLRGRPPTTVVLVGPSHRAAFAGCALQARGSWQTPLGEVAIEEGLASALLGEGRGLFDDPDVHRAEHSLEMQMPFLQRVMPGLRLVPVLMGSQEREEVDGLAAALAAALRGRDALLVASSDLSHYHPAPVANALDGKMAALVEAYDPEGLMELLERDRGHACGGGPMVAVMKAARTLGARSAALLRYADSGDAGEHDKSRVVGYLSAALLAPQPGS